jgi:hypothetical protein
MDAPKTAFNLIAPLILAVNVAAAYPTECNAGDPTANSCCCHHLGNHFDGSTRCRWHRTWHGPNAVWQPLSPYYIPRPPDSCKYGHNVYRAGYDASGFGCACGASGNYLADGSIVPGPDAAHGYGENPGMQAGFERLGQIPNDLGISSNIPAIPHVPRQGR